MVRPDEQEPDRTDPVAPPGSAKNDSETAQRAEDDAERDRGGPDEAAVEQARRQLNRLREER
jgi:hypothetical protein